MKIKERIRREIMDRGKWLTSIVLLTFVILTANVAKAGLFDDMMDKAKEKVKSTTQEKVGEKKEGIPLAPKGVSGKMGSIKCGRDGRDTCSLCDGKYVNDKFPGWETSASLMDQVKNVVSQSKEFASLANDWIGVKYVKFNEFKNKTNAGVGYEHTYCWKSMKTNDLPCMKTKGYEIMEYGDNQKCVVTKSRQCIQPEVFCKKLPSESKFRCSIDLVIRDAVDEKCGNNPGSSCGRFMR
jgi:hypothetical protein